MNRFNMQSNRAKGQPEPENTVPESKIRQRREGRVRQPHLRIPTLFTLLFLLLMASAIHAATTPENQLFSKLSSTTLHDAGSSTLRSRHVETDVSLLLGSTPAQRQREGAQAQSRIALNLFDDVVVTVDHKKNHSNRSGSLTWIGEAKTLPNSTVIFVVQGESLYGLAELPGIGAFSIRPTPKGTHIVEEVNEGALLSGESDFVIPPSRKPSSASSQRAVASSDDGSIIDVYVVYDQDADGGSVAAADAQAFAELFIAYTNQAYENSNIDQRVWLVGSVDGYDYTDSDPDSLFDDLFAARDGSLSGLHAKRDEYHADLVMFFVPSSGSSCGGLAFIQYTNDDLSWSDDAYSTMEACSIGQAVFAHELGHNMGSRHDWYMDSETTPDTIAHGYVDLASGFRTIMAYSNRCSILGQSCSRIAHFSNPSIDYSGQTTGVAAGTSSSCAEGDAHPATECDADAATLFNNKAPTTAKFRDSRLTWTGSVDSDWNNAANWTINEGAPGSTTAVNRVPRPYDNLYIPGGLTHYPMISSGTHYGRELIIADGARLEMAAGTLQVGWRWEDVGGFSATGGTVEFSGPIGVTVDSASTFQDVRIGDGTGSTQTYLASNLDVDGNLTISAGASLDAGTYTLNLAGDWQENNPTGFAFGSGRIICDGAAQSFSKIVSANLVMEDFSEGDGQSCCSTSYLPPDWTSNPAVDPGGWYGGQPSGDTDGNAYANGDAWLYSLPLTLNKGVNYSLSLYFDQRSTLSDTLRIYLDVDTDSTSTSQSVGTVNSTGKASFSFSVPSTATYYIGFHHDGAGQSYLDDVQLDGASKLSFHDLEVKSGTTSFSEDMSIANDLLIHADATADFGGNVVSVEGTLINDGSIKQTSTVSNGATVAFGRVKNAGATLDKYFGVEITPNTGDMGETSVEIRGNQTCEVSGTPASGVERCYVITPAVSQSADATFYYRSAESNGNNAPNVYLDSGASWTLQTTQARGGSGAAIWVTGSGISASGTFLLADSLDTVYHTVTPEAGTGGSLTPSTAQIVAHGNTTSFTVASESGYTIDGVSGCGGNLSGNTYDTGEITADCTVTAIFIQNTYTVTPTAGTGGTLSPNTAQTIVHGNTTSFTVAPESGYSIASVTGCNGSLVDTTYTTGEITANCTVTATFSQNSYTVTPSAGAGGGLSPSDQQTIVHGNTTSFTVAPESGYSIASVTGCNGSLVDTTYTTGAITSNCMVEAKFVSTVACARDNVRLTYFEYTSIESEVSIETDGVVELRDGDSVVYTAPVIRFLPGFHAQPGSNMQAIGADVSCF